MKKILLVDDEAEIIDTLRDFLEDQGYECLSARDGFEALSVLRETVVDVIVSDLRMPTVSGLELVRSMRDLGIKTPVIWLTGYANSDDFKAGWSNGLTECLEKPVNLEELKQSILTALALGPEFTTERRIGPKR